MKEEREGYIVEYVSLGNSVKVTAIDTITGREVCIVGSRKAPPKQLADVAIRKLKYVIDRDGE